MKERKVSIRGKLLLIVLIPVLLLSIVITIIGIMLFYSFYTQSIRGELVSTTNMMFDCLELATKGDYAYEDNMLLKGNLNISDADMLLRVKEESQIDTTIFWGDTRILTTVEDEQGASAVGTKAGSEVIETVLGNGQNYFSDNLEINGVRYVGYYVPIVNSDGSVVGMMFAGKSKSLVYQQLLEVLFWFIALTLVMIVFAVFISIRFSAHMISDIETINDYLKTIAEGDLRTVLDGRITKREDELGSIGVYASIMRNKLQKLVEMDALTNIYNRRSANLFLETIVQKKESYCLIMCDIDLFKQINDNYGHDAGDYVLVEIAKLMRQNVAATGCASRWGGEEFLLVYSLDFEETRKKAKELQQSIWDYPFVYHGQNIAVTMTFGIAEGREDVFYEKIVKEADEKLYIGKNSGRNKIVC